MPKSTKAKKREVDNVTGITTLEGVELFKSGLLKPGNVNEIQKFDADRLDRIIGATNARGYDTAIAWIEHPSKDYDKYLYKTDRKTGNVAPLFGGFRNWRRIPDAKRPGEFIVKADAILQDNLAEIVGDGQQFSKRSVSIDCEGEEEVFNSVAFLAPEINPIIRDLAPIPGRQLKMSEFEKYFPAQEGGDVKRFTLTTDFTDNSGAEDAAKQLQFSQEETTMPDEVKELASQMKDLKKQLADKDKQILKFSEDVKGMSARVQKSDELFERVEAQLKEANARTVRAESANIKTGNLQFSESLREARMSANFVDKISAIDMALRSEKKQLKFSETDTEAPVADKLRLLFSEMVKDPTGVFVPAESDANTKHKHPAGDKGKGKDKGDGTKLEFSEVTENMDAKEASFVAAMDLGDEQLVRLNARNEGRNNG